MKIAAIGAGGVNGYFGARLVQGGADVAFLARGKHLAAIREKGLKLESPHGSATLKVKVYEKPAEVGPVDVVAECGRTGGVLESVVSRAGEAGVLRPDFGAGDLATMIGAMSKVIAMSNGDDALWRRHLGFVLDGLRAR